jgi:hypothetical protein
MLGAPPRAQSPVGTTIAQATLTATVSTWLQGDPVRFAGDAAPACTVFALYPGEPARFAADGDYLDDLQRRFADDGLRVVAVVDAEELAGTSHWPNCAIALDPQGALATAWSIGRGQRIGHVVVADGRGRIVFVGRPESGLIDAIERTFAGRFDADAEQAAAEARLGVPDSFDDLTGAAADSYIRPVLALSPKDGVMLGLSYLAQATKANDADAAQQVLRQALQRLDQETRPLAAFADLCLRGDPGRPSLAKALRASLQTAAAMAPHDPQVQLAFLRALVLAGDDRQVGRHAMKVRKLVISTADGCLDFASILTLASAPQVHRDLADIALSRAQELGADLRVLAAVRYGVAVRCAEDESLGKDLLADYLQDQAQRVGINNDCWYFMTQVPTMGRCDWFAAGLADRMLEQKDSMDYFEFDTAALAMFLVGRVDEAVELQQVSIEKGGAGSQEYVERLERYKARQAVTGAPPK